MDGAKMYLARYPKRHAVEGNPPFYDNIFDKIDLTVDMYYPADTAGPRPTVFYISGWHNYHSEQVYSLLYFIASHGYNAVHIPYEETNALPTETVKKLPASFMDKIDKSKMGILGYSWGAGPVFTLARDLYKEKEKWGGDGLFLFTIAGGGVIEPAAGSLRIPQNSKVITLTYNEEKNNRGIVPWDTDPRNSIDYLKRSKVSDTEKTYLYLPGDNNHVSDHATHKSFYNFKTGKFTYDALQQVGIFRPLKSLMEYTFNNNTEWKHIGLPNDGKTDMRSLNGIDFYSGDSPCVDLKGKPIDTTRSYKFPFEGDTPCND
jgi:hypothetical protein